MRIPGGEDLTLDQAYKAMAWLGEDIAGSGPGSEGRHTTDAIEEALFPHRQELFGEISVGVLRHHDAVFRGVPAARRWASTATARIIAPICGR